MIQDKVINLIEDIKRENHLSDEDLGSCVGLKGPTFRGRRVRGNIDLWQLEKLIKKYDVPNEVILDLFGRKVKQEPLEKKIFTELKSMRKEIEEIKMSQTG